MSDITNGGPMLAADGTPLKRSLARALRAQKLRALALIAPLLLFVLLSFIAPIVDMLFRSVENQIVSDNLPRTVQALQDWDNSSGELPGDEVFDAAYEDVFYAAEYKEHTKLGTRLNYETTGLSSLFRKAGRGLDDVGEVYQKQFKKLDKDWDKGAPWAALMGDPEWLAQAEAWEKGQPLPPFVMRAGIADVLPRTAVAYQFFAEFQRVEEGKSLLKEEPWSLVHTRLYEDLRDGDVTAYTGPGAERLQALAELVASPDFQTTTAREGFAKADEDWLELDVWTTIKMYSPRYTDGYFLNSVDMQKTPDGPALRDEKERIYGLLFKRTMYMSMVITFACIALAYPIAYLLSNLPMRVANLLMILVLLPFWTSLLVRTSAWKVMLQQQGVVNDVLVWIGLVDDAARLVMINNQLGTIIAMTHILLPYRHRRPCRRLHPFPVHWPRLHALAYRPPSILGRPVRNRAGSTWDPGNHRRSAGKSHPPVSGPWWCACGRSHPRRPGRFLPPARCPSAWTGTNARSRPSCRCRG